MVIKVGEADEGSWDGNKWNSWKWSSFGWIKLAPELLIGPLETVCDLSLRKDPGRVC